LGWEESGIVMAGISKKRKKNLFYNQLIPLCPLTRARKSSPVAIEIPPGRIAQFPGERQAIVELASQFSRANLTKVGTSSKPC
jgi:hypothetical protein